MWDLLPKARVAAGVGRGAPLLELPHEVLILVLRQLCLSERAAVEGTCTVLRKCVSCPSNWSELSMPSRLRGAELPAQLCQRLGFCRSLRIEPPVRRRCRGNCSAAPAQGTAPCCGGLLDSRVSQLLDRCRPGLTHLDLSGHAHVTATSLVLLLRHSAPTLEVLRLRGCSCIATGWDAEPAAIPYLPRLRVLEISHTNATDALVDSLIEHCPALEELSLNFLPAVSDSAVRRLLAPAVAWSRLKLGLLGSSRISDRVLNKLMRCLPRGHLLCDISYVCEVDCEDGGVHHDGCAGPVGRGGRPADAAAALQALLESYHREEEV
jgi:hypothetical protein